MAPWFWLVPPSYCYVIASSYSKEEDEEKTRLCKGDGELERKSRQEEAEKEQEG